MISPIHKIYTQNNKVHTTTVHSCKKYITQLVENFYKRKDQVKVLPEPHRSIGRRRSPFLSPQTSLMLMLRDHGYRAIASRGMPVYAPDVVITKSHCR